MHKWHTGFVNNLKILYNKQFGSQKKKFLRYTTVSLIYSPEKAMDNNLCEIFIDLQKAFDTIDHLIP